MKSTEALNQLIQELTALRGEMLRQEEALEERLGEICAEHRHSARNLAHYLVLRRHDIRDLQERLSAHGLSSLGTAEAEVLGSVNAVLRVLYQLVGQKKGGATETEPKGEVAVRRWEFLERNTEALLGPAPKERNVRIMVTMPSEAAVDFGLVRDLLVSGMNCMRVNCTHDGPEQWEAMIANLKKAITDTGKSCRVHMDLGGPKLRTGPLEPGPAVVKYRPRRDAFGRTILPAKIFLTSSRNPETPSTDADACVPVPGQWLTKLAPGDQIKFKDARGASRSMRVTDVDGKNRWAESEFTSYLTPGMILQAEFSKNSASKGKRSRQKSEACRASLKRWCFDEETL